MGGIERMPEEELPAEFDMPLRGRRPSVAEIELRILASDTQRELADWAPLKPVPEDLTDVPLFPSEVLPSPLRDWIIDAVDRLQVPTEMVAAPALVAAAAIIGRSIGICPEEWDDWLVVPNLWGAIVGRPGVMKSPAVREATRHIRQLATDADAIHQTAQRVAGPRVAAIDLKLKALARSKRSATVEDLEDRISELMEERARTVPVERRYTTQDATVEKLADILVANPRGILLLRDELAGWLRGLDKAGREGDREFYLEAWNGDSSHTVDRIKRGTIHVPAICLSVFGTIQPGKLRSYLAGAAKGGEGDDGLVQRLQVTVWPDTPTEWHRVDHWPDSAARQRAWNVYERLSQLDPGKIGANLSAEIPTVRFDGEAQELFDAWRFDLEARLRSSAIKAFPSYEAHLAKYRSLMPTLALLLHVIDVVDGNAEPGPVTLCSARTAAAWTECLDAHARRLYGIVDPVRVAARALADHIRRGQVSDGQTIRDLGRNEWSGLTDASIVRSAIEALAELNWLRVESLSTGGRPAEVLRLHPSLRNAKS